MNTLHVSYSPGLVLASVAISMLSAYAAFSLADRMRMAADKKGRFGWLLGGSSAMGIGIWSMHYLGMLAVRLPVEVGYYVPTVVLSLLLAIGASSVALLVVSGAKTSMGRVIGGGALMGAGIGGMHYTGMEAMRMQAMHHYNLGVVALSVVVAVVLSSLALALATRLRNRETFGDGTRMLGGAMMGCAIATMHYTAMAGVHYTACAMSYSSAWTLRISALGEWVLAIAAALLLIAVLCGAAFDRKQFVEMQAVQRGLLEAQQDLLRQQRELMDSQQNLMETNARLNELSIRDGLTGLYNRRYFDEMLDKEWRRALRNGDALALLIADIDCFKKINDLLGHQQGDECLRAVARALVDQKRRAHDVVARYGGEEFAILLPGADLASAYAIAEQLRAAVEREALPHPASTAANVVTISVGVCSRIPDKAEECEELVRAADACLYAAKGNGRNRVEATLRVEEKVA